MPKKLMLLVFFLGLLGVVIGCSGSSGGPTIPEPDKSSNKTDAGTLCLGAWQVAVNKETGELNVYQARGSDLALNVLSFMEPPPLENLSINFSTLVLDDPFLEVDVIFTHPIADPVFTGFDVRGVVFGPDVLNADGYTPYMRPDDFTSVPFGYKDGLLGAPDSYANYSNELNGYKYFADGLGKDDSVVTFFSSESNLANRGKFANGSKNTRHYVMSWEGKPAPLNFLVFNYAVYANYDWPTGEPPITLDDFAITANSQEAFCFKASIGENTLYYSGGTGGGAVTLNAELWDWQGFDDYDVTMEAGSVFGGSPIHHDTTSPGSTSKSQVFTFTAVPGTPTSADNITATITATDKSATFGSSWFMHLFPEGNSLYGKYVYSVWYTSIPVSPEAPQSGWARTWGGYSDDYAYGVATDPQGNSYVSGIFNYDTAFDPDDPYNYLPTNGGWDCYLSKFDPDGDFVWVRTWGGPADDQPRMIDSDSTGVYVGGWFGDSVDFNPDGGALRSANGVTDGYLSKFDFDGNFKWVNTWGGDYYEHVYCVSADGNGNVYAGGAFASAVLDFTGCGGDTHPNSCGFSGIWDCYIVKFDSDGTFGWAWSWGYAWGDEGNNGVAGSPTGVVYATGSFTGPTDFNPGGPGGDESTVGGTAAYCVCFDSSGAYQWVTAWADPGSEYGNYCSADNDGNAYVAGSFDSSITLNPDDPSSSKGSMGAWDVWLVKLDPSGVYQWGKVWGGDSNDQPYITGATGSGDVYVSGYFRSTSVDFNPDGGDLHNNTWPGEPDVYLSKFSTTGDFDWALSWGSAIWSQELGFGIAAKYDSVVFLSGIFADTVDFKPGGGDPHPAVAGQDAYLMKLLADGSW